MTMVHTRDSHDGEAGPAVAAVINQLFLKKSGRYVLVIDAGSGNGSFLKWTHDIFKRDGNYQRQRLYLVGYENNETLVEQSKELLQDQPNTKVYLKIWSRLPIVSATTVVARLLCFATISNFAGMTAQQTGFISLCAPAYRALCLPRQLKLEPGLLHFAPFL